MKGKPTKAFIRAIYNILGFLPPTNVIADIWRRARKG